MSLLRHPGRVRSVALALALVAVISSCTRYVTVPLPYRETLNDDGPKAVRVTFHDGEHRTVRHPHVEGCSLLGFVYNPRERAYSDSVRFALADVTNIEQTKKAPTWAYVALGGIVVGTTVWLISNGSYCSNHPNASGC